MESKNHIEKSIVNLLNQKAREGKKKEFQNKLHELIKKYNNLLLEKEKQLFSQKQTFKKRQEESRHLQNLLRQFNKISKEDEMGEYRQKKEMIKKVFMDLKDKPVDIDSYISKNHQFNEGVIVHKENKDFKPKNKKNGSEEMSNQDKTKPKKSGNKVKQKIKKELKEQQQAITSSPFPFKTERECLEKAISKPTFVKKNDIVRVLEKIGFQKYSSKPLSNLTKDDLCSLYFSHK